MPVFATLIVSMFTALAGAFTTYFGARVGVVAAGLATIGSITVATGAALGAALAALLPSFPSALMGVMWLAVPDNYGALFTAAIAAEVGLTLYGWQRSNIRTAIAALA